LEARREALDALNMLVSEGRAERITRAEGLAKDSAELPQVFETWQTWWRDVLLLAAEGKDLTGSGGELHRRKPVRSSVTNVDYGDALEEHARRFSIQEVQGALNATRLAVRQLGQNANARLVTEVLALRLPRV
jgi:hypothetical protein